MPDPILDDSTTTWFALLLQTLTLQDYNTRLVVLSTAALGLAAGMIGSFLLLRKRSLMGDALSHATLPGVVIGFMVMVTFGGTGKWLPGLLLGATLFGLLGVVSVLLIRSYTRIKDDTAMGIVLSVYFGLGIALLGVAQRMPQGNQAGLESFIFGKTASMIWNDFLLICAAAIACTVLCGLLFKEFRLLCFDEDFAQSQGWPVRWLDMLLLGIATGVTVIGLQSVGLILIIALLITPPAAARFWTHNLLKMLILSAAIGMFSGWAGATISAMLPRMPAGAVIVVVVSLIFLVSMILGIERGVLPRQLHMWRMNRQVIRQNLLRALYELHEIPLGNNEYQRPTGPEDTITTFDELSGSRFWSEGNLRRAIRLAQRAGLVTQLGGDQFRLTERGFIEACRHVRNHRLWEVYLITHADVATGRVDRDADRVEHVLGAEMVARLEQLLEAHTPGRGVPDSPHALS